MLAASFLFTAGHAILALAAVSSQEGVLPGNSGCLNVHDLGARGDGKSDDTKALQDAMGDKNGFIFLPNGTYLVSDTISGAIFKRRFLQGQSRAGTIIRLKDHCPGFDDPAKPKPVVSFFERFMDPKSANGQAFRNALYNLTIDVGSGNPGAVALHYFNDNEGIVENVTLRSSDPEKRGKAGLALVTNWPGPALIRNLSVEGFDFGIWSTIGQYSMAFEHISLQGQRVAGIKNSHQMIAIRDLKSRNAVPALALDRCLAVLVDADLGGGNAGEAAIENKGQLYARNVKIQGYKLAIRSENGVREVSGPVVEEYTSHDAVSLFPTPPRPPKLPVEESPTLSSAEPGDWVAVQGKDQEAVQKAIDSGKPVVYFPKGVYVLQDTIHVRGAVRRLVGMESTISTGKGFDGTDKPAFRIEDGKEKVVVFERFEGGYGNRARTYVEQATSRTLVLKAAVLGGGYRNTVPGSLFIDDVCGAPWEFKGQKVWARQLNPENQGTKILNDGGSLWILNLKTEKAGTAVLTRNGGRTEILGGYLYYNRGNEGTSPIVSEDSQVSFVAALNGARGTLVEEKRGGESKTLTQWPFLFSGSQEKTDRGSR